MDVLWAPWRLDYILGPKPDTCVLCVPAHEREDRDRLILARASHAYVIMNKYPYSNGHLMVTPYRHVSSLTDLSDREASQVMDLLRHATAILRQAFNPQGVNIGLNMGEAAGAGIEEHLHFHLVPRWNGDSSFMAVFGETRVIPEHLLSSYERLKPYFDGLQLHRS